MNQTTAKRMLLVHGVNGSARRVLMRASGIPHAPPSTGGKRRQKRSPGGRKGRAAARERARMEAEFAEEIATEEAEELLLLQEQAELRREAERFVNPNDATTPAAGYGAPLPVAVPWNT